MTRFVVSSVVLFCLLMTGSVKLKDVTLTQLATAKPIASAALLGQGVAPQAALTAETRKSAEVNAIVSYADVWRWGLVMYLRTLTINTFDASSGNLLASGRWEHLAFHSFQDAKLVTSDLMAEMFAERKASGALKPRQRVCC